MDLENLINRQLPPEPWAEGEKIPWNDPAFSRRMLREHLSQEHDAASRRFETIDRHVAWIHDFVLQDDASAVLDLGCGPGLYTTRLAGLGHLCLGIDYAPAAIDYAREQAAEGSLACRYQEADVRSADFGSDHDLAMMINGELNVFRLHEIRAILSKCYLALKPGGRFLAEVHTLAAVQSIGQRPAQWSANASGLFSDRPHLYLYESFWDDQQRVATERYFILDAVSGALTRYAASTQAFDESQYRDLLADAGFEASQIIPSLTGAEKGDDFYIVLLAEKGNG